MKKFCDNPYCENPGFKEVPVSVRRAGDQKRTLCAPCEEAWSWGAQHGTFTAEEERRPLDLDGRELATVLAALRFHQDENLQGSAGIPDEAIKDIASDGGRLRPLDFDEVGQLCERLNVTQKGIDWQSCEHDWQDAHGPKTGCGTEYWFRCSRCGATRYRCIDQDESVADEVHPPDPRDLADTGPPPSPAVALQRIHDLLYLDMKDGQESHDPDKEWDTDVLTMIAEVVAEYIPRPR